MFEVMEYRESYRKGIVELMNAPPFKEKIWHWQFEENPYGHRFDPVVLLHEGKVVGFNGVMPVDVLYNGERITALWSCDFYVDSTYRGKGLGRQIKNALIEKSDLIASFGISRLAAPVLLKMGWRGSTEVGVYRKYRKVNTARKVVVSGLQFANRLRGTFTRRHRSEQRVVFADVLPEKTLVDDLWSRVGGSYRKIVVRNYAYLQWHYERHPLARYRFAHIYAGDQLVAIGVYRAHGGHAKLVDMLCHAEDRQSRNQLVDSIFRIYPDSIGCSCVTTDKLLGKCLQHHGFFKAREEMLFFVRSDREGDSDCEAGWFIITGDSDGELLDAAACNSGLTVRLMTDSAAFGELEPAWNDLLENASANRLFLGWQWLYSWWETWGGESDQELFLLLAYREDALVGIAPLYLDRVSLPGGVRVRRLQFIGNVWRHRPTVRTEYLEFIADKKCQEEVCAAFVEYISAASVWDEFVICDLLRDTETYRQIQKHKSGKRWLVFDRSIDYGVRIDTTGSFSEYLAMLGRHTRLRLYNRRKHLDSRGDIKQTHASLADLNRYFDILNSLHRKRWGRDCFSGSSLQFHKAFLSRLGGRRQFDLACIFCGDDPISIIYNIRVKEAVFNLQSGFVEDFDKKLSLGTLHLGLSIEEAFNDPGVHSFDLLAGRGKKYFYKPRYHGEKIEFVTLQIVRKRSLQLVYRLYLLLPGRLRGEYRLQSGGVGEW